MPPQLREIGCHVENHATQWRDFQHEMQFQEIGVAWIQLTQERMCISNMNTRHESFPLRYGSPRKNKLTCFG